MRMFGRIAAGHACEIAAPCRGDDATARLSSLRAREAQRPQARCQWLHRVRSAVTQWVNSIEAEEVGSHKDLQMKASDQLTNPG